jgi:glycosyltransferase involved in cell wall biosynthesis
MDSKNKLKLIYDVSPSQAGYDKNVWRSGVFFTVLNILKELTKRNDVDLILHCSKGSLADVKQVLNKEIPGINFQFLIKNKLFEFYNRLKDIRRDASRNRDCLKKISLQLLVMLLSPINKLITSFELKRTTKGYDAFLSPAYLISDAVTARKYVILHDLIPMLLPEYQYNWKRGKWQYDLCVTLNHDDYYFTNSENTRKDFLKYYPQIDPEKIRTTLLACGDHFKPNMSNIEDVKEKYGIPKDKKYVFSLCSLEPRKNLQRSVATFAEFLKKNEVKDMIFVLGGGHYDSFIKKLEADVENFGEYKNKIVKIGYVDDEDLSALYSGAEWFTYTSMYEGFGLPALEAMSCGCPVIASNNSSLPEVVGDAGILIDWDSDEQHVEAYEKYYFNPQLRETNREKGLARAKEFSWAKCVNTMVEAMKKDCNINSVYDAENRG